MITLEKVFLSHADKKVWLLIGYAEHDLWVSAVSVYLFIVEALTYILSITHTYTYTHTHTHTRTAYYKVPQSHQEW